MKYYSVVNLTVEHAPDSVINTHPERFRRLLHSHSLDFVGHITQTSEQEWQMVFKNLSMVYPFLYYFLRELRLADEVFYVGIGIGEISTLLSGDTRKMDGSSFAMARQSLNLAKTNCNNYMKHIPTPNCHLYLSGFDEIYRKNQEAKTFPFKLGNLSVDFTLNTLIQNNELLLSRITKKQWEVIECYERHTTYREVIQELPHLSKSMISDRLKLSSYHRVKQNIKLISSLMKQRLQEPN